MKKELTKDDLAYIGMLGLLTAPITVPFLVVGLYRVGWLLGIKLAEEISKTL